MRNRRLLALRVQAAYYVASGTWPLVSRRSFETITGRKQDWWLVQMVGLLAMTNGIAIGVAALEEPPSRVTLTLSLLSACSFAAIDIIHALKGTISSVYLADAAIEAAIIAAIVAEA